MSVIVFCEDHATVLGSVNVIGAFDTPASGSVTVKHGTFGRCDLAGGPPEPEPEPEPVHPAVGDQIREATDAE